MKTAPEEIQDKIICETLDTDNYLQLLKAIGPKIKKCPNYLFVVYGSNQLSYSLKVKLIEEIFEKYFKMKFKNKGPARKTELELYFNIISLFYHLGDDLMKNPEKILIANFFVNLERLDDMGFHEMLGSLKSAGTSKEFSSNLEKKIKDAINYVHMVESRNLSVTDLRSN